MVELLSGMYAALRAILQLSEVAHKTALEKGQEERFMSPTPIMRRVTGWLAYGSTWSFWLLSADGDLEGCAARATETHVRGSVGLLFRTKSNRITNLDNHLRRW
jgi:hypothetical protein